MIVIYFNCMSHYVDFNACFFAETFQPMNAAVTFQIGSNDSARAIRGKITFAGAWESCRGIRTIYKYQIIVHDILCVFEISVIVIFTLFPLMQSIHSHVICLGVCYSKLTMQNGSVNKSTCILDIHLFISKNFWEETFTRKSCLLTSYVMLAMSPNYGGSVRSRMKGVPI